MPADGIEKLQVHGSDVGDHADLRPRDLRQRANFARMRHAHFDDRDVVLRFQLQEHERQSEMIIEVAFRFEHAEVCGENMRDRLLWSSSSLPNR